MSLDTSAIQYENDDLIRAALGDDTAIACCVSAMRVGKDMQFFGARVNLAKALLYAINGGRDEITGEQVAPGQPPPVAGDVLDYDEVRRPRSTAPLDWLAETYVDALNVIHYMHDKYAYERLEMALHDYPVHRFMAMRHRRAVGGGGQPRRRSGTRTVKVLRDETGLAVDYVVEGDYPAYGNNDDRADAIAVWLVETFMAKLRRQPHLPRRRATQSVLTITSNVVYGKHTGNTPDGRRAGEPFAPGRQPDERPRPPRRWSPRRCRWRSCPTTRPATASR